MRADLVKLGGFAGALALAAVAGCFSPNLGAAPFNCGAGNTCPGGYVCQESVCRLISAVGGDGGVVPDGVVVIDGVVQPPPGGTQSCTQVLACAGSCSGQGCTDDCKEQGTAQAQARFDALSTCLNGPCHDSCTGGDGSGCGACANMQCKDQLDACQSDTPGAPPDGGPAPDATWQPPGGWMPQRDMGGNEPDVSPGFDVIRPPEDMGGNMPDTVTPPPDVPRPTDLSCGQVLACINGCGDQTCADDCYARGTPEAQATYDAASACVSNNCPLECLFFGGAVCDLCVEDMCSAETGACQ